MKKLIYTGLTLVATFFVVLILMVIVLGATGFSEKIGMSMVIQELRGLRTSLAQTIHDPDQLEKVIEAKKQELIAFYGLDKPWYFRIPRDLIKVLKLDLGEARTIRSMEGSNKISDIVLERLPKTLLIMLPPLFIVAIIGLAIGPWLATRVGTKIDRFLAIFASASFCTPTWWIGIIMILILSITFQIFPSGGMYSHPPPTESFERFLDLLWHAFLPILTLVLISIGPYLYDVRIFTLRSAQENFVFYAKARGVSERRIRWHYILRNAAPPIVTGLIFGLTRSITGAILTETVFNWPGMGRLYYEAILAADIGVIIALTFIYTLIYILTRFALEFIYLGLDPRIRY